MKDFILFAVLVLSAVGTSCCEDDDQQPSLVRVEPLDAVDAAAEAAEVEAGQADIVEDLSPNLGYSNLDEASEPTDGQGLVDELICGKYYSRVYSKINDHLTKALPEGQLDVSLAMSRAVERLEIERSLPTIHNKCFLPALEQFVLLKGIDQDDDCSWEKFKVIYKNDRAIKGVTHRAPSKLQPTKMRKLETIVHHYAFNHAIKCHLVYPARYAELVQEIDAKSLATVEQFADAILKRYVFNYGRFWIFDFKKWNTKIDIAEILLQVRNVNHKDDAEIAFEIISQLAAGDPDSYFLSKVLNEKAQKLQIREDKVTALVQKYLVKPCEEYLEKLASQVFIPALFDVTLLESQDGYHATKVEDEMGSFLIGMFRYRVCDLLVRKDQMKLAKKVAQRAGYLSDAASKKS